ncbi:MAG TPA: efflux RND transporter periplasmic adaptor subunit [bacterium]
MVRLVLVGVVMLALAGGTYLGRSKARPAPAAGPAAVVSEVPASVVISAARRADVVTRVLASGSVTSIRDSKIGSKLSGRVAAVLVEEGQRVSAGTPLLRLDASDLVAQEAQAEANVAGARARLQEVLAGQRPEERQQVTNAVAQAEAALRSAQASLELAQANVQRMRSLRTQGAVSQQDLDAAETQARVAQSQVVQAQAAYDSAKQGWNIMTVGARQEDILQARAQLAQAEAGLAMVREQLRESTISAPFDGTIIQRNVEPGEVVSSAGGPNQSPLFVLSQVDDVYVEFIVPAQHRAELQQGQAAQLAVEGLPGRTFEGRVAEIRPAADVANRSFGVKVRVPNPKGALRPGMFARGAIVVGVRQGVLSIPEQAVLTATSGPIVFVARGGRAVRQSVTLGEHQNGSVEVTSGLADGDPVVVEGQDGLTDNQPVTPRTP